MTRSGLDPYRATTRCVAIGVVLSCTLTLGNATAQPADTPRSYVQALAAAEKALRQSDYKSARAALSECPERDRGWEWRFLSRRSRPWVFRIPGFAPIVINPVGNPFAGLVLRAAGGDLVDFAVDREGRKLVAAVASRSWPWSHGWAEAGELKPRSLSRTDWGWPGRPAFNPDGTQLALSCSAVIALHA